MRKNRGFAVSELLMVAAVAAVLAAAGYPSYLGHVSKGRRADVQATLTSIARSQEVLRSRTNLYASDLEALGIGIPESVAENYTITLQAGAGAVPSYSVVATPKGTQRVLDKCAFVALNQDGFRLPFGCW